jgi:hypothetical protein
MDYGGRRVAFLIFSPEAAQKSIRGLFTLDGLGHRVQ